MPVLKYTTDGGATWLPLTPGPPGPPGPDGGTMWVQPAPPVVSQTPAGYPLWLDTDEPAIAAIDQAAADLRYVSLVPIRDFAIANTAGGWASNPPVDKQGKVCTLVLNCQKATWGGGETICTLPAGFRPAQDCYFPTVMSASGGYNFVRIASTGAVITGLPGTAQGGILGALTFFAA